MYRQVYRRENRQKLIRRKSLDEMVERTRFELVTPTLRRGLNDHQKPPYFKPFP